MGNSSLSVWGFFFVQTGSGPRHNTPDSYKKRKADSKSWSCSGWLKQSCYRKGQHSPGVLSSQHSNQETPGDMGWTCLGPDSWRTRFLSKVLCPLHSLNWAFKLPNLHMKTWKTKESINLWAMITGEVPSSLPLLESLELLYSHFTFSKHLSIQISG